MIGTLATIIATGAVLLLAGCGDDDAPITSVSSETTTGAEAPAGESEFIPAADSVCAEANAAIANLSTEVSTSAAQELGITQGLLDGLQELDPPSDPALDEYFAALEDQVAVLEEQESALAAGDPAGADALTAELEAARSEALSAASAYGFEECGQEGTELPGDDVDTGGTVAPVPVDPAEVPVDPAVEAPAPTTPPVPVEPVEPAPAPAPEPPPAPSGGTGSTGGAGSTGSTGSGGGIGPG